MKGNEVTKAHIKEWEQQGNVPVCCRLCGEVWLYPKRYIRKDIIANYECPYCAKTLKREGKT